MSRSASRYYWLCQISGWVFLTLMYMLFYYSENGRVPLGVVQRSGVIMLAGILTTHLFREFIRRSNWLRLPVEKALPRLFLGVVVVCVLDSLLRIGIVNVLDIATTRRKTDLSTRILLGSLDNVFSIVPWTLIYYFYHYIDKSRKQQFDTLKLEALVKELELKTIKSHINPHFIFNSLNSIRALVDENPSRARTAITELSNILRSSMQTEKQETVSFEKELNIVKDYLALEHIRFEDRLKVEYEVDENTLDQPIPPMMLQTLVENAIKHGISKQVNGGTVKIISDFKDNYHELVIRNTGHLNGSMNDDGFGLASTRNRLQLLFGFKAVFDIKEIPYDTVQATVLIPIAHEK
jgi:two-component system, LytTR family, sensor kinase